MGAFNAALPAQTAGGGTSITMVGVDQTTDDVGDNLVAVRLTPPAGFATVTGVVTNNATFNVRQLRAGVSQGTVATLTLSSGNNLVAETPIDVPITAPKAVQRGDVFDVQMVQNGAGLAVGVGVQVEVELN